MQEGGGWRARQVSGCMPLIRTAFDFRCRGVFCSCDKEVRQVLEVANIWPVITQDEGEEEEGVSSYAQEQEEKNVELEASMTQALKMMGKRSAAAAAAADDAAAAAAESQSSSSSSAASASASASASLDLLAQVALARKKGQWRGSSRVDVLHVCFGK